MTVLAVDGLPAAIGEGDARSRVTGIEDHWSIDDEWWREPIQRRYYRVSTESGVMVTLFHDLATDTWFEQRY